MSTKMMVTLKLRYRERAAVHRVPQAMLVMGDTAAEILEVLSSAGLSSAEQRIFAMSSGGDQGGLCGVLVPASLKQLPLRAQPLTRLGKSLYYPLDADLDPPMTPEESDLRCATRVHLLHPTLGEIGFDPDEALQLADLLEVARPQAWDWEQARPGPAAPPPLTEIRLDAPLVSRVLSAEVGDGVATEPPPRNIQRKLRRIAKLGDGQTKPTRNPLVRWVARAALKYTGRMPETATHYTIWNRVEDWAKKKLGLRDRRAIAGDDVARWLLRILEEDPDAGLRHAIPLGGSRLTRGEDLATEVSLSDRDPVFALADLANEVGGSGGYESMLFDVLRAKYRQLAEREAGLGRHKRAAYILAVLLGDFRAAASALERGGEYRDAAAVLLDQCEDRMAAAQCLRDGGFLEEAAELYRESHQYRLAGELLWQLRRHEDATRQFVLQVHSDLDGQHYADAAETLERHLGQPERAHRVLLVGFRDGRDAENCLERWFRLAERRGWTEGATRFVEWLRERPSSRDSGPLARVLAGLAAGSQDLGLRAVAADACRVVVGAALLDLQVSNVERRELLDLVVSLDDRDVQLRRDAKRYRQSLPKVAANGVSGSLHDTVNLGSGGVVAHTISQGAVVMLTQGEDAGSTSSECILEMVRPGGVRWIRRWPDRPVHEDVWLFGGRSKSWTCIIPKRGRPRFEKDRLGRGSTPKGAPDGVIAAASMNGHVVLLAPEPAIKGLQLVQLKLEDEDYRRQSPVTLGIELGEDHPAFLTPAGFLFAAGAVVHCLSLSGSVLWALEFPSEVVGFTGLSADVVIVSMAIGCALLRLEDQPEERFVRFAEGHSCARVCPLGDDLFVVVSTDVVDVYRWTQQVLRRLRRETLLWRGEVVDLIESPAEVGAVHVLMREDDGAHVLRTFRASPADLAVSEPSP